MKFRGWHIDGFGLFDSAKVDDLSPGLVVVAGPNEAGKSTLLHFLQGMLFGFELDERSLRFHPPLNGGPWGGRLAIDTDEGTYIIERFAEPQSLAITGPDGTSESEDDLRWMLGGIEETTYRNVFAFGLGELEDFSSLSTEGIGERLFSAGLVGAGTSARAGAARIEHRMHDIFHPDSNEHLIGRLRDDYRTLNTEVRRAQRAAEAFPERHAAAESLETEARRLERELEDARETVQRCEALLAIWPDHLHAEEAQAELDALPPVAEPVDEPDLRLERIRATRRSATDRLDEVRRKEATSTQRLLRLEGDETLHDLDEEIQSLFEELAADQARGDRRAEVERALLTQQDELAEELRVLGPGWDRPRLAAFDASIPAADEVRQWARLLTDSEDDIRHLDTELASVDELAVHANRDVERLRTQLEAEGSLPTGDHIDKAHDSLRRLRSAVHDVEQADAAMTEARSRLERIEQAEPTTPSGSERAVALAQPALYAGSFVLVAFTVFCLLTERTSSAMIAGIAALTTAGLGLVAPTRHVDRSAADADAIRNARADLEKVRSIEAASLESVEMLAGRVGLPAMPVPTATSIDRSEAELLSQRDARREVDRIAAAHGEAASVALDAKRHGDEIRGRRDVLATRRSEIDASWAAWKSEREVPQLLSPEGVTDFFTTVKRARSTQRRVELLEIELSTIDARSMTFAADANDLLRRSGRAGTATSIDGPPLRSAVRRLHDEAIAGRDQRALFLRAQVEHGEVVHDVEDAVRAVETAETAHRAVLAELGAVDETEFRANLAVTRRRAELTGDVKRLRRVIATALGEGESAKEARVELESGDVGSWDLRRIEELTRIDRLQLRFEDAIRRHQDATQELDAAAASPVLADLLLRREEVRSNTIAAVEEWERLKLAHGLMMAALAEFEEDHQPAVLERAQTMFASVTDGRYQRLVPSEHGIDVVDGHDRRVDCARLSRGSAEQLYLCIRLALAAELAHHAAVPLVLDDVLVNFDPSRSLAMARVIAALAADQQIFVFTCHPQTEELLRQVQPEAQVIPLVPPIS